MLGELRPQKADEGKEWLSMLVVWGGFHHVVNIDITYTNTTARATESSKETL